ncbi:MAG: hypothetical protein PHS82_01835 [Lachnospiraceae bacterium]|nr:hypothetical protein [Lachnospiraceae bacterium]
MKKLRTDIFRKTEFGNGIIRIEVTGSVFCYLVLGEKKLSLLTH